MWSAPWVMGAANSEDKAAQALGSLPREEGGHLLPTNSNSEAEQLVGSKVALSFPGHRASGKLLSLPKAVSSF